MRFLTKYSAISAGVFAALLTIGFVIHARLAQLLGIDLPSTPTDYLTAAGDFLTSLMVRTFTMLRGDITMTRLQLLSAVAAGIAIALGIVLRRVHPSMRRRVFAWLCLAFITFGAVTLLGFTMSLLRLRNVLQPANHTHRVQRVQRLATGTTDPAALQRLIVDAYKHQASILHDPIAKACFNPASGDTAEHRQNLYAGTILAAVLLLTALLLAPKEAGNWRVIALSVAWGVVLISLPLAYATLGRNFTYPVVQITQGTATYCGYLLASDGTSVTLYDRPGGFRLRRIPREHLLIDQLATASPFQGCGPVENDPEGFLPCENLFCTP